MPNLNVNILGRDGNTRAKVTGQEELLVSVGSVSPSSGLATEATLKNIEGYSKPVLRTPGIATLTGSGLTTSGVYSFSIANVGGADGLVGGETISAGMTISFDGGALNNTLDSISFNATGTTFIITYIS